MTLRAHSTTSRPAYRSLWLVALALQLIVLAVLLHRFAGLPTPVALNLIVVGLSGALIAVLMSLWSLADIWRTGRSGTTAASATLVLAGVLFLWPAYLAGEAVSSPMLSDVTTDAAEPPSFVGLASARGYGANSLTYAAGLYASVQQQAYPDIGPVITPRPVTEAFAIAREVVKKAGLDIAVEEAPGKSGSAGHIEASETTLVMGFVDDIAIRVAGDERFSRIDLRSQSRYGLHDLGRNAQRVRMLIKDLHSSLDASAPAPTEDVAALDPDDADGNGKKLKKKAKRNSEELAAPSKSQAHARSSARRAQVQKEQRRKRAARRRRDTLIDALGR